MTAEDEKLIEEVLVEARDALRHAADYISGAKTDSRTLTTVFLAIQSIDKAADRLSALSPPQPRAVEPGLHPETARLIATFAVALAAKLRRAEIKYGYSNGWAAGDWQAECQRHLAEHVAKGDPLDVAAYAAFCWHHGWPTASLPPRAGEAGLAEHLQRVTDHLETWAADHAADRTAETDAAIWCARQALAALSQGSKT